MVIVLHDSIAVHPGPWLKRNFIEPYGMTVSSVAAHLDVTRAGLSKVLNGRSALSPALAARFERAFGVSAATLLRMQATFAAIAARAEARALSIERVPEPA